MSSPCDVSRTTLLRACKKCRSSFFGQITYEHVSSIWTFPLKIVRKTFATSEIELWDNYFGTTNNNNNNNVFGELTPAT